MLTEEVYSVLEEMDRQLNDVFYQVNQLRVLGDVFLDAESHDVSVACYIGDYCVPAVSYIESLRESLCRLKEFFPGR
jgi:hypothetical protein